MPAFSWVLAAAFVVPPPAPTPPPDVPPVYRTAAPVVATPSPSPTPSPRPVRTPSVWRFGTPSPSATPVPSPLPTKRPPPRSGRASGPHDPVRFFTGGGWACRTLAGTPEEHRYVAVANGFDLHTFFQLKGRRVQLDENYRMTPRADGWTVTLANGTYVATAGPWNGPLWTFNGSMHNGANKPFAVRMIYQYFDEHGFRRDFQVRQGDGWSTSSAETCVRAEVPTA